MARRQYLICYDISDDKRRTRVFNLLMGLGDHLQYSVFLCILNDREIIATRSDLAQAIHARDDQVVIVDLGSQENSLDRILECLGKRYDPPARVQIV